MDGWPTLFTAAFAIVSVGLIAAAWLGIAEVPKAPPGVVQAFYEALADEDLAEAERYLSEGALRELDSLSEAERREWVATLTNGNRTLTQTLQLGTRNYGARAVSGVLLGFDDQSSAVRMEEMVREEGSWHLTWPVGTRRWNDLVEPYDRVRQ